ncbi:MAG: NTP transferase domain-containing protein [Nitrosomonadales bacterium]|nr:NTP transferase domain-containing protein [Nitrosomonadales bacterium]
MTTISFKDRGAQKKILAIVLAGGVGARLRPLTAEQAKPAMPFGGSFRLVDFVLSNLVNSGIDSIYVLVQYKPESLIGHVGAKWCFAAGDRERFVRVVLPQREFGGSFRGTADAVYQNLALIERHQPDLVAVFAADQVYRMDVGQMVQFHRECDADITVAATQVPIGLAPAFGIIETDCRGGIVDFQEKPEAPAAVSYNPSRACASMGNYLFDAGVLVEELERAERFGETDFGAHLLPRLIHNYRVHAYDFSGNTVPGVRPYEEPAYWRDIGTLEAYVNAHRDILGNAPLFNLQNPHWPLHPALPGAPVASGERRFQQAREVRNSLAQVVGNVFPPHWDVMQTGNA